ncbi:ANTAR domain-containing response regulator [Youxingia wuxianensis]|uniref:Stage 0 sporulation protein A homolog n=1 Tax=Youxingia wuxianensis TaxID=2763678 RepID=A0A926ERD6_9FIRM|nr:response regulator [Youxingia wuxianensis]MBC8585247.1 response regulator [Youxingia wuxianensis]
MGYKVVIADDEAIIRLDLKEQLQQHGYEVVGQAGDGFDAISLCKQHAPDLVLLDIKMPLLDGLSAAKVIIEENLAGCVVLSTAYSDDNFIKTAKELGVMGYVVKPIDQKSLIPAIEVAIARSQELMTLRRDIEDKEKKMEERKVIEKAKGVLMKKKKINEQDAYEYIRLLSMKKRTSMKKIAELLILSYQDMPDAK